MINIKEFLARQLNDHSESPSGVIQKTYFEWTENHLADAVQLALCYVYSILPQEFSELETYTVTESDCVISFCDECPRFIGLVSLKIGDEDCIELNEKSGKTNSLSSLLFTSCINKDDDEAEDSYEWNVVDGGTCIIKFDKKLPIGAEIRYLCAPPPEDIDSLNDARMCQYLGLIADYALWWLFRTDSESRSNLERARLHFEGVKDFVTTKLLIEFSLREDDYNFGRRSVDD